MQYPLNSIHYNYGVSHHRHQKRMNTIIRAVIAQGVFFLNRQITNIHSYTLTSHIPHSSQIHISNKKERKKKDKKLTIKDKTGHDKRGQDKTRHPSVQPTFSPIHTNDIKTGTKGNITLSLICTCKKHCGTEQLCAETTNKIQDKFNVQLQHVCHASQWKYKNNINSN